MTMDTIRSPAGALVQHRACGGSLRVRRRLAGPPHMPRLPLLGWACPPQQIIGAYRLVAPATFLTPEDYTCTEFEREACSARGKALTDRRNRLRH